ncbi:MAG: hypothetical protein K6A82_02735 [Prevotella sp.]|nr:hypothetical protein [Prevotella sp.]
MKKYLLTLAVFFLTLAAGAQRTVDGIQVMIPRQQAMQSLVSRFGEPVSEVGDKVVFNNVLFNGEQFSEANFFFDGKDRLHLIRLKNNCGSHAKAVERMDDLWKKYGELYSTTEGMNHEDGKFVVGYDKDGTRLFTIATFRNRCDLSFGPF